VVGCGEVEGCKVDEVGGCWGARVLIEGLQGRLDEVERVQKYGRVEGGSLGVMD